MASTTRKQARGTSDGSERMKKVVCENVITQNSGAILDGVPLKREAAPCGDF